MHGQDNLYSNATVSELIACNQDANPILHELDMAYSHPVLHLNFPGPSIPTFTDQIMYHADTKSLPPYPNAITTPGSTLYSLHPYVPSIGMHSNTDSCFSLSPQIVSHVSSSIGIGVYTDVPSCNVGTFQLDSIPRAWNLAASSQSDNCVSSAGISHKTTDITRNNDLELSPCDSSAQADTEQALTSKSDMKTNTNPTSPLMSKNVEDGFRYPCFVEGCNKTFARKEHATRHYRTKHEKSKENLVCEFCGKDTFNRTDNLNAHRKLHARDRPRHSNAVHFVPSAVLAMRNNRKRGRPRINGQQKGHGLA